MKAQALAIYDNGGLSWDRYTIVIGHDVFGMSENPKSPDGFNQYTGAVEEFPSTEILGKEKLLEELPKEVRLAIQERMNI